MRKIAIKVVRPWPAEQPRPPVVHLANERPANARPANDTLPSKAEKRRA